MLTGDFEIYPKRKQCKDFKQGNDEPRFVSEIGNCNDEIRCVPVILPVLWKWTREK